MNRVNTLYRAQTRLVESSMDERAAVGLLDHLDKEQLQALLDSESKVNDLIDDLQQVKDLEVDREMLMASNKSLAEFNLSQQPDLESSREMLAYMYRETEKLKEDFEYLKSIIETRVTTPSLDSAQAVLMARAAETEEKTEHTFEAFITGQLDCDAFVDQYIEQRAKYHIQKVKSEKLGEIIQNAAMAQRQTTYAPLPGPQSAPPYPI